MCPHIEHGAPHVPAHRREALTSPRTVANAVYTVDPIQTRVARRRAPNPQPYPLEVALADDRWIPSVGVRRRGVARNYTTPPRPLFLPLHSSLHTPILPRMSSLVQWGKERLQGRGNNGDVEGRKYVWLPYLSASISPALTPYPRQLSPLPPTQHTPTPSPSVTYHPPTPVYGLYHSSSLLPSTTTNRSSINLPANHE